MNTNSQDEQVTELIGTSQSSDALDTTLELARRRAQKERPDRASHIGAVAMGVPFLIAAAVLFGIRPHVTGREWLLAVLLGVLYLVASSVQFEATLGSTVPSEQVLVAMYLLLPAPMPPLVALLVLICIRPGWMRRPYRAHSFLLRAASACQTMGPVLVLLHFGHGEAPALSHWPLYVAALLSQFLIDMVLVTIRARSLRMPLRSLRKPLLWTWAMDSVMATIGLSAVLATGGSFAVLPFLAAPIGLIWLLAKDRQQQVETSLTLGQAVLDARGEARVDQLTGAANRRAWEEAVAAAQTEIDASWGTRIAAIAIADVDRLKQVNDTLGHSVGDALIAVTANALRRAAPEGATLARIGGDEFGVLWVTTREEFEAAGFVASLRTVMTDNDDVDQLQLLASIGFATTPPATSVEAAIEHADVDLFQQKELRRSSS